MSRKVKSKVKNSPTWSTPKKKRSILTPFTPRIELTPVEHKVNTYRINLIKSARRTLFDDPGSENLTDDEIQHNFQKWSRESTPEPYISSGSEYLPSDDNEDETQHNFQKWSRESTPEPYIASGSEYLSSDDNEELLKAKQNVAHTTDDNLYETTSIECKSLSLSDNETDEEEIIKNSPEKKYKGLDLSESDTESEEEKRQRCKKKIKNINGNNTVIVSPCLGKRYEKKQCCLYCKKFVIKLARHLITCHSTQAEVQKIICLKPQDKNRKQIIDKIRNMGNFNHNSEVLNGNKDSKYNQLIVKRRPATSNVSSNEFLPCENCFGLFNKKLLFLHTKKCKNLVDVRKWSRVQSNSAMLMSAPNGGSNILQDKILNIMKVDEVTKIVKSDPLILLYGSKLCLKHGHEKHLLTFISTKMRELARLLIVLREKNETICKLQDIFTPKNFQLLVDGVHTLTGYNPDTGKFKIPSLAKKLGHSIKYCSNILLLECVKNGKRKLQKKVKDFIKIFDMEWYINISRNAISTLYEGKWNKTDMLPLAEDIFKLNLYLTNEISTHNKKLLKMYDYNSWNKLSKLMLARIILFNRRRAGEAQRLTINNLQQRSKLNEESEVYKCLSITEKVSAKQFNHIELKGKRGRKVPILLLDEDVEKLQLLINYRSQAGVDKDNPYVFGRLQQSTLRGPDVLNFVATECGAKHPHNLTSTKLRKHIATSCQILNLNENQMDYIANYMGHDIKVHRNFYRLPDNALHLAKMSKLLTALDEGKLNVYKGKNLDEISLQNESDNDDNLNTNTNKDSREIEIVNLNTTINIQEIDNKKIISKPKTRKYWSADEIYAIKKHLNNYLISNTIPGMIACLDCKNAEPALNSRTWVHIKSWVHNQIKKSKLHNIVK